MPPPQFPGEQRPEESAHCYAADSTGSLECAEGGYVMPQATTSVGSKEAVYVFKFRIVNTLTWAFFYPKGFFPQVDPTL
jgi:hypothetical protein